MKRDHLQSTAPRRSPMRAAAVLLAGVCAAAGLGLGMHLHDHAQEAEALLRPTLHGSVFADGARPSAVPDHALLSASDVERALPVPPRAYGPAAAAAS